MSRSPSSRMVVMPAQVVDVWSGRKSAISYSGRISISLGPGMGLGQRFTQATASSMSLTSQSQKPATSSRVSAKGPSMTVRRGPSNAIRLPCDEGLIRKADVGSEQILDQTFHARGYSKKGKLGPAKTPKKFVDKVAACIKQNSH